MQAKQRVVLAVSAMHTYLRVGTVGIPTLGPRVAIASARRGGCFYLASFCGRPACAIVSIHRLIILQFKPGVGFRTRAVLSAGTDPPRRRKQIHPRYSLPPRGLVSIAFRPPGGAVASIGRESSRHHTKQFKVVLFFSGHKAFSRI